MNNTRALAAALLASAALMTSSYACAAIDTPAFTFSTGWGDDMTLLSSTQNTYQISMNRMAWDLVSLEHNDSKGSTMMSMVEASVKEGYRIVSFTMTSSLTGALNVAPIPPSCGSSRWESCTLGSATNRAMLRWVLTDMSAEGLVQRENFAGQEQLSVTSGPVSLQGQFAFVTESFLYVARKDTTITYSSPDRYSYEYLPSTATISMGSPVVLTVQVAPVPEPGTYAMLLAGLGLLGWTARKQRK